MIEASYTSMQATQILAQGGIKACRERVTQLCDDLFGRDPTARGRTRRITVSQMAALREAFVLIDSGLPRHTVIDLFHDPKEALSDLVAALNEAREEANEVEAALSQFEKAASLEERGAAIRRVQQLRQRRWVAA